MFFVLLVPLVTVTVLVVFLLANGVSMIRRESRSLGNLLSFLARPSLLGLLVLLVAAQYTQHPTVNAATVSALAGAGGGTLGRLQTRGRG